MSPVSLSDKIRAAQDLRYEEVRVPEWGLDVPLRLYELDGVERLAYDDAIGAVKDSASKVLLAAHFLVFAVKAQDEQTGAWVRVFADDAVEWLTHKNAKVLARLFNRAAALSVATEKEVEAAAGKSEGALSGATSGG